MQVLKAYLSGPITANKHQQINTQSCNTSHCDPIYTDRKKLGPITQTKCMINISSLYCRFFQINFQNSVKFLKSSVKHNLISFKFVKMQDVLPNS